MSKENRIKLIVCGIVFLSINAVLLLGVLSFVEFGIVNFEINYHNILTMPFWKWQGILFVVEIILIGMYYANNSKPTLSTEGLENAELMGAKEKRRSFTKCNFKGDLAVSGILAGLERNNALIYKMQHGLVLGSQGTGKTTTYVQPQIEAILRSINKPSLIVTDIKGELLRDHGKSAEQNGYVVKVFDLKNPEFSLKWNPLQKMIDLQKLIDSGSADKKKLEYEISEEVTEEIEQMFPKQNMDSPVWEQNAQDVIKAILYAMLEDLSNGVLGEKQFNYITVGDIVAQKGKGCENLITYFEKRNVRSNARRNGLKAMDLNADTRDGFTNHLETYVAPFSDKAVESIMLDNEFNYKEFATTPTILFIELSEIKISRHSLATGFIAKLYRELLEIADENSRIGIENREVLFLFEEAGNLPAIPKIDKMMSAGRGRKLFVVFVIQSYAQLSLIYGEKVATIIRDNIDIEIFIGTSDMKTAEEFSRKCGNKAIESKSLSKNSKDIKSSTSTSAKEVPLFRVPVLMSLNDPPRISGNAVIMVSGEIKPLKAKYTPYYKINKNIERYVQIINPKESDENVYFDISQSGAVEVAEHKIASVEPVVQEIAEVEREKIIVVSNKAKDIISKYSDVAISTINEYIELRYIEKLLELTETAMSKCESYEKILLRSAKMQIKRGE